MSTTPSSDVRPAPKDPRAAVAAVAPGPRAAVAAAVATSAATTEARP